MRTEKKAHTRQRMVEAAAEGFRSQGWGIGVDALARRAGVTSGAFYVHFGSKAEAFRQAVDHGLTDLLGGVRYFQQQHGAGWWPAFVEFYLSTKRTCDLAQSCSLQTLTPEVARADQAARDVFQEGLLAIAREIVQGPASPHKPETIAQACGALAQLTGAVSLARAVSDSALAHELAESARAALLGQASA